MAHLLFHSCLDVTDNLKIATEVTDMKSECLEASITDYHFSRRH